MEKEIDVLLLDHLHSLQRIEKVAERIGNAELMEAIKEETENVNEKLYRKPPYSKQ